MSLLDFINRTFGESTDLPIQVDSDNNLFVEEKREPNQPSTHRPYQGFTSYGGDDDSDSIEE